MNNIYHYFYLEAGAEQQHALWWCLQELHWEEVVIQQEFGYFQESFLH